MHASETASTVGIWGVSKAWASASLGVRAGMRAQRVSDIALHAPSLWKGRASALRHQSCPEYDLETGLRQGTAAGLILGLCWGSGAGLISRARRKQ